MRALHIERHLSGNIGWLRAAVLGANDGILSTSSLVLGVALTPALAKQVATQLMAHDAIGAHTRDELGISETLRARPVQASVASAASFAAGAVMPLIVAGAPAKTHHLVVYHVAGRPCGIGCLGHTHRRRGRDA